jgi:hypothetical protein
MLRPHRVTSSDLEHAREISRRLADTAGEPSPVAVEASSGYVDFGALAMPASEIHYTAVGENTAAAFSTDACEAAPLEAEQLPVVDELGELAEVDTDCSDEDLSISLVEESDDILAAADSVDDGLELESAFAVDGADELSAAADFNEPTAPVEPADDIELSADVEISDDVEISASAETPDFVESQPATHIEVECEVVAASADEEDDVDDLFESLLIKDDADDL